MIRRSDTSTVDFKREALLELCQACLRSVLGEPARQLPTDVPLHALGLDSRATLAFLAELSRRCGRALDPALPFAHPTLERLAAHLCGEQPTAAAGACAQPDEAVAILGIGCRFPGGASSPEAFWALLARGGDAVTGRPAALGAVSGGGGAQAIERGGFLGDVAGFDAAFFGISPREAAEMDPQQRLMLELSWEALEDAGVLPATLAGSRAGVFFGCMWRDYMHHSAPVPEAIAQHTATGLDTSIIAARVSYRLGLRGPSLTVNTACSSSLVAVHLACQSLRQGESTLALAGGVNLILSRHSTLAMERFGGLAPDGRCKTFDAAADGYVRGEGGGVVVLKLLRDALRDGDPIYCVIRGSSVNNDGASNGLTAPSPIAQAELLRDACGRAGVEPRRVHYVEAHGTGTRLGDAIEVEALGRVLGRDRAAQSPLRVGSVKTNLGHLEAAAGIAGLIKVALAVQRRWLPQSLHLRVENPALKLAERGLAVQREAGPWPAADEAPLAGVSAFGFGGTNAHVVVEGLQAGGAQLLVVAAEDHAALARRAACLSAASEVLSSSAELASLCEASALHWGQGALRRAHVVTAPAEVRRALDDARAPCVPGRRPRLLFVFSGVGSHWLGMGRELLAREPGFRAALEACDTALAPHAGFSVIEALGAGTARELERCARYEPLIFSIQVALSALLRGWGIRPDAVIGHSIGELAAAHCAGILTLADAALAIGRQARLFSRLEGQGAMALLALGEADARRLMGAGGAAFDAAELALAALNGPTSSVVSGPYDSVAALLELARARGVFAARVQTEVAFHSPAVASLAGRLGAALAELAPHPAHTPMLSTVRGDWLLGPECDAAYWVENQRAPVRFAQALARLREHAAAPSAAPAEAAAWAALELAPHAVLGRELRAGLGASALVLPTLLRGAPERKTLFESVAALYEAGLDVDLRAVARSTRPAARLPEAARRHLPLCSSAQAEAADAPAPLVLPLSAHTPQALRALAEDFREQLRARGDLRLEDVVGKAATARTHFAHRLAVSGSSRLQLCEGLAAFARGDHAPNLVRNEVATHGGGLHGGARRCVFVFSGHGSQWPGMCNELLAHEPVFREVIERCEALFERHGVRALRAQLEHDADTSPRADQVQPRLFAVQAGLAALWRSWGVEPAAVIGHSVGEIAAAHVAGCLDLESAARVVCERAGVLAPSIGRGGMLLVELPRAAAQQVVERYRGRLALAVHHSPRFSVLSGELDALSSALDELVAAEVFCRRVAVDYASHGPQMVELAEILERRLQGLAASAPRIPMMSTSSGGWVSDAACGAAYWARNLREPVRFHEALSQLLEADLDSFLELSPHPLLTGAMQEIGAASALPSLRRGLPQRAALKESLGALFTLGHEIDWARQFGPCDRRVPLPTYPFQRTPHWKSVAGLTQAEPITGVVRKLPSEPAPQPPRAELASFQARLTGASTEQRRTLLRTLLLRELARVLRADPAALDPETPFSSLGLDSLLGLELRNRVEAETGVAIPGNLLWSRPSVNGLEHYVLEKLTPVLKAS